MFNKFAKSFQHLHQRKADNFLTLEDGKDKVIKLLLDCYKKAFILPDFTALYTNYIKLCIQVSSA